jgi:hypothetical protein
VPNKKYYNVSDLKIGTMLINSFSNFIVLSIEFEPKEDVMKVTWFRSRDLGIIWVVYGRLSKITANELVHKALE